MKAWKALAKYLWEAASALSHSDVRQHLQNAVQSKHPDRYPYVSSVYGDHESGDVVYGMGGDYFQAPYEISTAGGAKMASIGDHHQVMPRIVHDPVPNEADWTAAIEGLSEADKALAKIPGVGRMLFYERFVPKSERDSAGSADFAGKGKSFPILKPEDIAAAFHSLGRAGADNYSAATIRSNIIKIAKRKGWASHLPMSAQSEATEAARDIEVAGEFVALREGAVMQDGTALLKLIAPGWGSSGYYAESVLKRDGPKVFRAGTKNFWNHQTQAEESARPEGNLDDLASVLTEDAHYAEGPKGPGLYAKAKVYEHYRRPIDDMSKDIGVSIRASGKAREGTAPDGKTGLLIEQLTKAHSADYVTTPGAGGAVVTLFEAARPRQLRETGKENDMEKAEVQALIEAAVTPLRTELTAAGVKLTEATAANVKLRQRVGLAEAGAEADKILSGLSLHEGVRARVKARVLAGVIPMTEAGDLDIAKFKERLEAEAKEESAYVAKLTEGSRIVGMGSLTTDTTELSEADYEKQATASFMAQGLSEAAAKVAAKGSVN